MQPGLDVASGLLEGLPLRDLGRVVSADPDHVGAQEDQHVGANLHVEANKGKRKKMADSISGRCSPAAHVSQSQGRGS